MNDVSSENRGGALTEVKALLRERFQAKSKPLQRVDGCHIALVIEGGGMRGVASGGMVSALEELGLRDCFDSVHGSSAGAAAGAYFVAGQAGFGTRLYYEDLNNAEFIDTKRFLWGRPILDTSYLVDFTMVKRKPLNFENIASSLVPLNIVSTDIDEGSSYVVSKFKDYNHYRSLLKASVSLPFIAGKAQSVDGRRLLDGGLLQQFAIDSAVSVGATHILTLLTRRLHELMRPEPNWRTRVEAAALQGMYGGKVGELYFNRHPKINRDVNTILSGQASNGGKIAYLALPDEIDFIHRLTRDGDMLKKAALASRSFIKQNMQNVISADITSY